MDTVSAESDPGLSVATYCVHTPLPVLVYCVPQSVVAGRDESIQGIYRQADVEPGIFTVIHT